MGDFVAGIQTMADAITASMAMVAAVASLWTAYKARRVERLARETKAVAAEAKAIGEAVARGIVQGRSDLIAEQLAKLQSPSSRG